MSHERQHTAHQVRLFRQIGIAKKPRKVLPRQVQPRPLEREYARDLMEIVRQVHAALQPLINALPEILREADRRFDSAGIVRVFDTRHNMSESVMESLRADADDPGRRARELANQAREVMKGSLNANKLEDLARKYARATSSFQKEQLAKQTRAAMGVDLTTADRRVSAMVDGFVTANVTLISNLPEQIISKVEGKVANAVQKGMRHEELAKDLANTFGMDEDRAARIARDQIGTAYGQINAARQQELGVNKFIWRTSNDERVRDEHVAREGETYDYDDPPDGELPGEPINCRCYAEPVFDMLEDET